MKKLFLVDLDDTLVTRPSRTVIPENLEALKKIKEHNHDLCICTGRGGSEIIYLADQYGFSFDHYIGLNGMTSSMDNVEFYKEMRELAKWLLSEGVHFEVQDNVDRFFTSAKCHYNVLLMGVTPKYIKDHNLDDINIYKAVMRKADNESIDLQAFADKTREKFGDSFATIINNGRYTEMLKNGVSKGDAMSRLFNGSYRVMCGDSDNDRECLIAADKGYLIRSSNKALMDELSAYPHITVVDYLYEAVEAELQ